MLTEDGCVSLRFSEKLTGYGAFWLYKILEAKKVLKRTKKITCSFVCSFNTIIIRQAKISSFIGGCIMKKVLTICLALLLAAGTMGGCSQSPAADPSSAGDSSGAESQEPQEHVTLTYMSRYIDGAPDAMGQFYYERLHQYDEENDNITIEDLSVNELDVYNSKLKSSIAANDYPDIITNYGYNTAYQWVKNDLLRDLTSLIESDSYTGPTDETYLAPWDYTANGIEGVYGIPANVNIGTVFYANKKLLEDNGLQVPETWEEINEMAPALIEKGITPIALSAATKGRLAHFYTSLSMRMYGLDLREKLISGEAKWSDEEGLSVFQKFEEMNNAGIFGTDAISLDASGMEAMFLNGEAAMYPGMLVNSTAAVEAAESEEDIVITRFPYFEDKPENKDYWFVAGGDGFSIMTPESENARLNAAYDLVSYMLSQESFDEQAKKNGVSVFPVDVDFEALGVTASKPVADFMEIYGQMTAGSDEFDVYFDFPSAQEIFRTEIQTMFAGVSAVDVAASIDAQYDAES